MTVLKFIQELESRLREKGAQAEADQRSAEERAHRAAAERRWVAAQQAILDQLKAELGMVSSEVDSPAVDELAYQPGTIISQVLGPYFWALPPEKDEETGEPIYDVRVVAGKRTSRERAYAAARVYGGDLRERALAEAIYRTGETQASSAASIRGSLGGLVKHGSDWRRERGQLIYQGGELKPDKDTILSLMGERESLREQASRESETGQIDRGDDVSA